MRSKAEYYDGGTIPWFKTQEINGWYLGDSQEKITVKALEETSVKLFPPNTVLMAMYGDGRTITSVGILRTEATTNQACCAMIVNPEICDHEFLLYTLKHHRNHFLRLASGGAQRNLNTKTIRDFEIAVPPLNTQRRIAAILSAYDDLIENNAQRICILEEMAQALYREWFVHFRFPGHEDVPLVESALGPIPAGWEIKSYSDIVGFSIGGDWGKEAPEGDYICPVQVIRGTDFDSLRQGLELEAPVRYIKESSLQKRKLQPGDVIVENSVNASSRCVGQTLLITEEILRRIDQDTICASFCKLYRPSDRELAVLAHLHMSWLYDEGKMAFYQNVATNGIGNFQSKRFLATEAIALPTDDDLLRFLVHHLSDLTTHIYAFRNAVLRETRDLLLPRLVSGEIDVSELDVL